MNPLLRFLGAILSLFLISCAAPKATNQVEKSKKKTTNPPELVGRIASIPPGRRFVLIQSYGKWNVPTNSILTTRGENSAANLLATGESLGQYAAADIQSGEVAVNDGVYYRRAQDTTSTQQNTQDQKVTTEIDKPELQETDPKNN